MAAGDIYKLTAEFTNSTSGEILTTGLHFTQQAGLTDMGISDTGPVMRDWWTVGLGGAPAFSSFVSASISLVRITQRKVLPLSATVLQYTGGLPAPGAGDDQQGLSPAVSVVASLRTGLVGRRFRGRMYLPPVLESKETGGDVPAADALAIADGIVTMIRAINSIVVGDPVVDVYSRVGGSGEGVTEVRVDRRFRTQRRRAVRAPSYQTSQV